MPFLRELIDVPAGPAINITNCGLLKNITFPALVNISFAANVGAAVFIELRGLSVLDLIDFSNLETVLVPLRQTVRCVFIESCEVLQKVAFPKLNWDSSYRILSDPIQEQNR